MLRDERIEQARNKIWAEMMQILYFIAILSFVIKILFLHQSLQDCAMEYLVLILTPLYQAVRARQLGVVLSAVADPKPKRLVASLVGGMIVVGLFYVLQGQEKQPSEVFTMLTIFVVVFLVVQFGMYRMGKRRQEKLEKEYDDEE
ncbi:hypothetical protein H9X85_10545 [Anaerotignum lactatifermentans]|uniref:Uncharacterized protein n=1 Tax=Anaerotignum lactatifermentans TaxID=160404 RepID=A0ABS2GCS6_9FIRM|nr:DUF6773 family protein [Anaerotignum lactatifermentans]MBM6829940.1 hypothetical protein [Anaerotignum lactatifermentans]MBM6878443.1 hypothetical protein [Anaerotignum lactatifermentans]MBM6951635.1 hypothetical protein [Anaerotignum lactatifermentans]